jgi:hypothetical protein
MSNEYGQPGTDPAGSQPTQPLWAGAGVPAGAPAGGEQAGFGPVGAHVPGPPGSPKQGRGTALRWTAGVLAAALLAGGGILTGLKLAGPALPASVAAGPANPALQGALLGEALNNASAPGQLTGAGATLAGPAATVKGPAGQGPVCAKAQRVAGVARRAGLPRLARRIGIGAAHCRLVRHRIFAFFLLRGVDGQFTVQTRAGTTSLAFERGVVSSVTAGKSITVKASDGTAWTWDLVSTTVVRDRQGKVSQGGLTTGTQVWVGGPVVQGAKDARLIVVRPPQPASAPPIPSSTPGN